MARPASRSTRACQCRPASSSTAKAAPTTDPAHVFQHAIPGLPLGALLPFGDHKGAGLSLIVELLSAGLMRRGAHRPEAAEDLGHQLALRRADRPGPARARRCAAQEPDRELSRLRPRRRAAGSRQSCARARRQGARHAHRAAPRRGIPLDDETWAQINAAAARLRHRARKASERQDNDARRVQQPSALSLPATTHVVQWGGAHVWKVGGKVFAVGGVGSGAACRLVQVLRRWPSIS